MAQTIKHREDGTFYEQGDTQGLVIHNPFYITGQFTSSQTEAAVSSFRPLRVNTGTIVDYNSGLDIVDETGGAKFISKKDNSVFHVNFGRMQTGSTSSPNYRLVIKKYHSDGSDYGDVVQQVTSQPPWVEGNMSYSVVLNKGDYFKLGTYDYYPLNVNINNNVNIARFEIINMAIRVPYIIANKGALVSGGAFQFDEGGNGYTENYDETRAIQVGWYKRADGKRKPVWRQIFDIPQYSTVSGDLVTVEIAPYGLMEILLDVRGWVVTTANPASYTPLLMNNSITGSTDFHMRWCGLYPQDNKGLLLKDRTGSAWGTLTFYGKAFVTFTKQSDAWE
jgi:hypothetical protein